jgi:cytosine/adenosine deaminase-related metal-dependent hydrolase
MESILIEHGLVVTLDAHRRVIRDGAVMIEGSRIIDVGKTDELRRMYAPEHTIDASRHLVIPGLIDCHVHLAQALIRGCADDVALIDWLGKYVWPLQGNYDADDGRVSAKLCMLEMIKSGTTSFIESMLHTRYGFDGIARAVEESGMRGYLAKTVMDTPGYGTKRQMMHPGMIEDGEKSLAEAITMMDRWNGKANGRIAVWFGPRSLGACSGSLYERIADEAAKRKAGITMHLCEVQEDVKYARRKLGKSPVAFVRDVGLLGPRTVLAHAVWLTDRDIGILSKTRTSVCHCPWSNAKLASGIARVPEMLNRGVNVALGCDGGPSNNTYDMIREMKLAACIHKARLLDAMTMPAQSVLEMATIAGARAIGMQDKLGTLESGKLADIILVNLDRVDMVPNNNEVSDLVYAGCGADVDTVIIDGNIVMEQGNMKTLDEHEIIQQARERAENLLERTGLKPTQLSIHS